MWRILSLEVVSCSPYSVSGSICRRVCIFPFAQQSGYARAAKEQQSHALSRGSRAQTDTNRWYSMPGPSKAFRVAITLRISVSKLSNGSCRMQISLPARTQMRRSTGYSGSWRKDLNTNSDTRHRIFLHRGRFRPLKDFCNLYQINASSVR